MTIANKRKDSILRKSWAKASQKPRRANSKFCISTSDINVFFRYPCSQISNSYHLCGLQYTSFSWSGSIPCLQLSLLSILRLWHLHLGISKAIQTSLLQHHTTASPGLHDGIALPSAWPQQFSLTTEDDFITCFLWSLTLKPKLQQRAKTAQFCCLLGLIPGPLGDLQLHWL